MSTAPEVSVIIVSYKSEDNIQALLDSIRRSAKDTPIEVIVVDNYLQDQVLEIASKHKLNPIVIKSPGNVGFSKAVNRAIKISKGQYILLINPDGQLVGSCLNQLLEFAKSHPEAGAIVPKIINPDGKPQPSVFYLPTILNAVKHYFFGCKKCFGKYLPHRSIAKVQVAVMAAFLIPRKVIDKVGLLDEKYFLYYEDVEYCRRLKKFHLPIYYLSRAKYMHQHGASGNFKSHLQSPLAKSAIQYHGQIYSTLLNFVLWSGQKWEKAIIKLRLK